MVVLFFIHERIWNTLNWGRDTNNRTGLTIQMTGLSGAGKSTIASAVTKKLHKKGYLVELLDGDSYRTGLCNDLGFSKEDRNENIRRLGFVATRFKQHRFVSIIAAINPYEEVRQELRKHHNCRTVYVKCSIPTLTQRDTKGLYKRALLPDEHPDKINNFTGISDPFDLPHKPDLILNTDTKSEKQCINELYRFIKEEIKEHG